MRDKVGFRLVPHFNGGHMVEVLDGKELIAGIYAGDRSVRVISKHPMAAVDEEGRPQAITIEIGRRQ